MRDGCRIHPRSQGLDDEVFLRQEDEYEDDYNYNDKALTRGKKYSTLHKNRIIINTNV